MNMSDEPQNGGEPARLSSVELPQHRRHWLITATASVATAAGLAVAWRHKESGLGGTDPIAKAFLQQSFNTPDGAELSFSTLRGAPLLVNFWAPWCAPCVEELPMLDTFYQAQRHRGWQLVGLAVDQAAAVQRFLQATPVSFPVAQAGLAGIQLSRQLGNGAGGLPFSVLFDARGRIHRRKLGQLSSEELNTWAGTLS